MAEHGITQEDLKELLRSRNAPLPASKVVIWKLAATSESVSSRADRGGLIGQVAMIWWPWRLRTGLL